MEYRAVSSQELKNNTKTEEELSAETEPESMNSDEVVRDPNEEIGEEFEAEKIPGVSKEPKAKE